jgi:hypothetical protein
MHATTQFCALPGPYGLKWPTLPELHLKIFGQTVKEAHNAAADVATCAKCFLELKRRDIVRVVERRQEVPQQGRLRLDFDAP